MFFFTTVKFCEDFAAEDKFFVKRNGTDFQEIHL